MNLVALVVYASLINWIATTIFVESTLFAPWRNWLVNKTMRFDIDGVRFKLGAGGQLVLPEGYTPEDAARGELVSGVGPWTKPAQLFTCHMCLGTWIGFIEAIVFGGPFSGHWYAVLANGLLYKAGGHLILELRSRIAKVDEPGGPTVQVREVTE